MKKIPMLVAGIGSIPIVFIILSCIMTLDIGEFESFLIFALTIMTYVFYFGLLANYPDLFNDEKKGKNGRKVIKTCKKKVKIGRRERIVFFTAVFIDLLCQVIDVYFVNVRPGGVPIDLTLLIACYFMIYVSYLFYALVSFIVIKCMTRKRKAKKNKGKYPAVSNATLILDGVIYPTARLDIQKSIKDALESNNVGTVLGGECIYKDRMEIEKCKIYLSLIDDSSELVSAIADMLNRAFRFPRGSVLETKKTAARVGRLSGLACYLDLTDMPCDNTRKQKYNKMLYDVQNQLDESAGIWSVWVASNNINYDFKSEEGTRKYLSDNPSIIGLYYYGENYSDIKKVVEQTLDESIFGNVYRIEQIN